jgi:hypothetical protein
MPAKKGCCGGGDASGTSGGIVEVGMGVLGGGDRGPDEAEVDMMVYRCEDDVCAKLEHGAHNLLWRKHDRVRKWTGMDLAQTRKRRGQSICNDFLASVPLVGFFFIDDYSMTSCYVIRMCAHDVLLFSGVSAE